MRLTHPKVNANANKRAKVTTAAAALQMGFICFGGFQPSSTGVAQTCCREVAECINVGFDSVTSIPFSI